MMLMTTMMPESVQKEMDERNLRPRLCYLTKGERGYGFHLHGERSNGAQYIRRIEAGSPAELAGLRSGDRVVEVNGENVEKDSHQQVVQKIMEVENRTRLLVVDRETEEFLLLHSLPCTEDLAVEMSCLTPRTSSSSLASSTLSFSSLSRNSISPSPLESIILSPQDAIVHTLSDSITPSPMPSSITSSPHDSIIPSLKNSTPASPCKPVTVSPEATFIQPSCNSINQSPSDSITQSPFDHSSPSPSNRIIPSPTNPNSPSTTNPNSPSPSNPNSPSTTNPNSPSPSNPNSPSTTNPNSPSPSNPNSPSTTNPNSPSTTNPNSPSQSNPFAQSPFNTSTAIISIPITQSPSNPFTPSPSNPFTQSPLNHNTQSPSIPITQSQSDSITTPFSREKSDMVDLIITTANKKMSRTADTEMHDLRPRLCHIVKNEHGFGFNLHCDKRRVGQYVRSVDRDSPAEKAGLQPGDRIVQVNGRNIEGLRHSEVVKMIRGGGEQTRLLVVDPETDTLFQKLSITPTMAHLNEDCVDGPIIESPTSTCPVTDSMVSPVKVLNGTNLPRMSPPSTNGSLKQQNHESSASASSRSIISEKSSSDTGNKELGSEQCNSTPDVKEVKAVKDFDPLLASGLHLSPTAAEARQKVKLKKANKRAPPMAWNKKYEIFSNF